jgi:hypothetical protein
MATRVVRTADILDGHVSLDVECLDRIYLNGYVPNLQVGGQVVQFLALRGFPIPSPVVVGRIGDQFRRAVRSFADNNQIPMINFAKGERKIEKMKPFLARQEKTARSGVVAIGGRRSSNGSRPALPVRPGMVARRISAGTEPTVGSPATTSTFGTTTSGRRSSRSAATSPTRSRYG